MNKLTNSLRPNEMEQNGSKWDEFDRKFWEVYKTIDENKLRRNVRWFAVFLIASTVLFVGVGLYTLLGMWFAPNMWVLALFFFGFATLFLFLTRRELAVWVPENAVDK